MKKLFYFIMLMVLLGVFSIEGSPFKVNPFINSNQSIGFEYRLDQINGLKDDFILMNTSLQFRISGDGVVGSKFESLPNRIDFNTGFTWHIPYRDFKDYVEIQIKALDLEATQDFTTINLSVKPQIAFSVPYSNLLFWWHKLIGYEFKGWTPLDISLGYAYVNGIKSELPDSLESSQRIETDIYYEIPVQTDLKILFRLRGFVPPEKIFKFNDWRTFLEIGTRIVIHQIPFFVKYNKGRLAPAFQPIDYWSTGVTMEWE